MLKVNDNMLLLAGPQHGVLVDRVSEKPVREFSLRDLHEDRLVYVHSGEESISHDHMLLQIHDGQHITYLLFDIDIKPKVDHVHIILT